MKTVMRNKKLSSLLLVLILTLATIGCGGTKGRSGPKDSQQGNPPSKEQVMTENDKNNDGKLSMDEFPGPDDHFSRFDTNSDGYLELDELPDGPPAGKRRR